MCFIEKRKKNCSLKAKNNFHKSLPPVVKGQQNLMEICLHFIQIPHDGAIVLIFNRINCWKIHLSDPKFSSLHPDAVQGEIRLHCFWSEDLLKRHRPVIVLIDYKRLLIPKVGLQKDFEVFCESLSSTFLILKNYAAFKNDDFFWMTQLPYKAILGIYGPI